MWLTPTNGTSQAMASALAAEHPDEQCPDQPGPDGAGHGVDAFLVDAGLDDRARDHRVEHVEVGPRRDLRHDTAEVGVQVDLRRHHARHHVVAAEHQRRGGLVAARLDAQHQRRLVERTRCAWHISYVVVGDLDVHRVHRCSVSARIEPSSAP